MSEAPCHAKLAGLDADLIKVRFAALASKSLLPTQESPQTLETLERVTFMLLVGELAGLAGTGSARAPVGFPREQPSHLSYICFRKRGRAQCRFSFTGCSAGSGKKRQEAASKMQKPRDTEQEDHCARHGTCA